MEDLLFISIVIIVTGGIYFNSFMVLKKYKYKPERSIYASEHLREKNEYFKKFRMKSFGLLIFWSTYFIILNIFPNPSMDKIREVMVIQVFSFCVASVYIYQRYVNMKEIIISLNGQEFYSFITSDTSSGFIYGYFPKYVVTDHYLYYAYGLAIYRIPLNDIKSYYRGALHKLFVQKITIHLTDNSSFKLRDKHRKRIDDLIAHLQKNGIKEAS